MKKAIWKILSMTLAVAIICSLVTIPSFAEMKDVDVTLVDETFTYADNTAAKTGLEKNFVIGVGDTNTWGSDNFGIVDGKLKMLDYSVLKYKNAISGAYEFSFDYNYTGSGSARTGRAAILFGLNPNNTPAQLYEAYPADGDTLGKSGFVMYIWNDLAQVDVRLDNGTGGLTWHYVLNNFSIVTNASTSTVRITIKYDGAGTYEIYSGSTLCGKMVGSNKQEVTNSGDTYNTYSNFSGTVALNGQKNDRTGCLVSADSQSVAFAHRRGGTPNTMFIDNVKLVNTQTVNVMSKVLDETFTYADTREAIVGISQNFDTVVAGTNTIGGTYYSFANNQLSIGSFGGLKYNKTLNTAYKLSYDYSYDSTTSTGRNVGNALILNNRVGESVKTLYEPYKSEGHPLAQSGLTVYFWNSSMSIFVREWKNSAFDFDSLCADVVLPNSAKENTITVTVEYDGAGKYVISADGTILAKITLSNQQEMTVNGVTYTSWSEAICTYAKGTTTYNIQRTDCCVPVDGTFAFGSRQVDAHISHYDNISLEVDANLPEVKSLATSFAETFTTTSGNELKYLLDNWQVYYTSTGGPVSFGTSMNITDGAMVMNGFDVIKYKKNLSGAIRFSYDLSAVGSAAGSPSGAAVVYRVSSGDNVYRMCEGYPTIVSASGIVIYVWDTWMAVYAVTKTASGISQSTIANNVYLGSGHVASNTLKYTIDDDGNGNINIFCDTFKCCSIKLSEVDSVSAYSNVYNAYTKAECTYAAANGSGTGAAYTATGCLIAKDTATVGFATRRISANSRTLTIDNVSIKATAEEAYELPISGSASDEQVGGMSTSISDNVGVNLFVSTSDYPTASYFKFVKNDVAQEGTISISSLTPTELYTGGARGQDVFYSLTCLVPAKEMNAKIKVVCYDADDAELFTTQGYSAVDYAKIILGATAGTYSNETVALCKAMLNFGAAAQTYLDYATDDLANKDLDAADKTVTASVDFDSFAATATGTADVTFVGSRLTLLSQLSLKLYFKLNNPADDISDFTFKVGTEEVTPVEVTSFGGLKFYEIEITNITPDKYGTAFVVTVGEFTLNFSVYSYAKDLMSQSGADWDATKTLIKAIRAYGDAVTAYAATI